MFSKKEKKKDSSVKKVCLAAIFKDKIFKHLFQSKKRQKTKNQQLYLSYYKVGSGVFFIMFNIKTV